jgi:hypothetical protein
LGAEAGSGAGAEVDSEAAPAVGELGGVGAQAAATSATVAMRRAVMRAC